MINFQPNAWFAKHTFSNTGNQFWGQFVGIFQGSGVGAFVGDGSALYNLPNPSAISANIITPGTYFQPGMFYGANTTVGSPTVFGASPNNLINFFGVFNGSFIGDGSKLTNLAWGGFSYLTGANIAGNVLTISPGGGGFYFSSPVSLSGNNKWTGYNTWDQYMVANGYTVNGGVDISIGAAYGIQADGNIIAGTGAGPGVSTNYIQSVGDIFAGYSGGPSQNISATGDITAAGSLYAITNVVATEKIQAGTSITCGVNGSGQFNGSGGGLTNVPVSAITGGSHTGYTDSITVPYNLSQDPDTMQLSWDTFKFNFVNGILISS